MTQVMDPTGAALGDFEELSARLEADNGLRTLVGNVPNDFILSVLDHFDLPAPLAAKASFVVPLHGVDSGVEGELLTLYRYLHGSTLRTIRRDDAVLQFRVTEMASGLPQSEWDGTTWHRLLMTTLTTMGSKDFEIEGADDVVTTIRKLEMHLGLPLKDVLEGAAIKRSSFFLWEGNRRVRPRVASQGRLWELAQFVEDLEETVTGSVSTWLLSEPSRRRLFREGGFSELLDQARGSRTVISSPAYARSYEIESDEDESGDSVAPISRPSRGKRSSVSSVTSRSRRKA